MSRPRGLVALCLVLLCSASARADTITISSLGAGLYSDFNYSTNGGTSSGLYFAGAFTTSYDGGSTFDSFCIDLAHEFYAPPPSVTWSLTGPPASTFDSTSDPSNAPITGTWQALAFLYNTYDVPNISNIDGAALQLALWAVEYDGNGVTTNANTSIGNTVGSGQYQFQSVNSDGASAIDQANLDIKAMQGANLSGQSASFFLADHEGTDSDSGLGTAAYQDLIGPAPSASPDAPIMVPEPSSIALIGIGLGGTVAFRARKARRSRRDA